ncbi:MAG: PD-(D/E)XK nuclease family protein [Candidatus Eremiobacteraeota bacterium]|nr:PD-(D/E)XK nuclease family protein [Candidatus Eremiobacteraeota bacterium]MBC5826269.1 PD-(D/E)XK nuclease family protein [Candidatus Eremiobacteraeota bacterium]
MDRSRAAVRRAAVCAALRQETAAWRPREADSASFVDGLCALSAACDRAHVDAAALAFAGADADEVTSGIARVLLFARHLDRGILAPLGRLETTPAQTVGSLSGALAPGVTAVPRAALNAFCCAAADRSASRSGRHGARRKNTSLAGAVADAGNLLLAIDHRDAAAAAEAADAVWAMASDPPTTEVRLRILMDGLAAFAVASSECILVADTGCDSTDALIVFGDAAAQPVRWAGFAAAVGVDAGVLSAAAQSTERIIAVDRPQAEAVAEFIVAGVGETTPWHWPRREAPRPLPTPAMTFSASRLNAYAKCPRRWFYDYLCDALEDPGSVQATYGKVFHEALEALHKEIRAPRDSDGALLSLRLADELDASFERRRFEFRSKLEYEVYRLKARLVAQHYVRWLIKEAAQRPFEIAELELHQRWSSLGHSFVGYVDRIDRPIGGGPITIFDYKTGRIDEDADEFLGRIRSGGEAQLPLYYAMRRDCGETVGRMALISIRDPRDSVWILALDIVDEKGQPLIAPVNGDGVVRARCSTADLETSLQKLIERCDMLARGDLDHFPAGDDPPCSFCAYARACRERPVAGERIFAR